VSTLPVAERWDLRRVQRGALLVGVGALVICIIGAFFDPEQFFRSYLAMYLFIQGLGFGCLAILMVYYLTGGAWGFVIRRLLEAGTRTLPLLALLLIPIGCGLGYLFLWARPEAVAHDATLQWQRVYLNVPFWWARSILYFVVLLLFTFLLNRWSYLQDVTGDPRYAHRLGMIAGPGLVAYGIILHFGAVDWLESLQPAFHSSIFGPYVATGQLLSAHALVLIVLAYLVRRPPLADVVSIGALTDLGSLLFTFLILWAYMTFFQFMLIWIANLPFEVVWYLDRSRDGWQWVAWAVFILHFGVPFFLLLMRRIKRNPAALAAVAGLIVFMHLVFVDYDVLPAFPNTSMAQHWMDFLMPFGLGGLWLANFLWELQRRPLLPEHDANQPHAIHLRAEDLERVEQEAALSHG
jgi:hypothetical protein